MKNAILLIITLIILTFTACSENSAPKADEVSLPVSEPTSSHSSETPADSTTEESPPADEESDSEDTVVSEPTEKPEQSTPSASSQTPNNGNTSPATNSQPSTPNAPTNPPAASQPEPPVPPQEQPTQSEVPKPVEPEPTTPAFNIDDWISFAKNYAVSVGLNLNSLAVDCWDNPITARPTSIYLERDIKGMLDFYAKDDDITDVWIWAIPRGNNAFDLMVGYG